MVSAVPVAVVVPAGGLQPDAAMHPAAAGSRRSWMLTMGRTASRLTPSILATLTLVGRRDCHKSTLTLLQTLPSKVGLLVYEL